MEWYVRYVRKMAIPQQICLLLAVQVINYMCFLQESEVKLSLKGLQLFNK